MNYTLFQLSFAGFLLVPAVVLYVRFTIGRRFPWWVVLIAIAFGGWLFSNVAVYYYFEAACEDVYGVSDPPTELLERCVNDGAKRVFALFFGWVYGLVYSLPYFLIFWFATWLRGRPKDAHHHAT